MASPSQESAPSGGDYCIVKVEVETSDGQVLARGMRFSASDPISTFLPDIYEKFRELDVTLGALPCYGLYYEPFSDKNTLLTDFLRSKQLSESKKTPSSSTISAPQHIWNDIATEKLMAVEEVGEGEYDGPPLSPNDTGPLLVREKSGGGMVGGASGEGRGRSRSIDISAIRVGAGLSTGVLGFWMNLDKSFGSYDLPDGILNLTIVQTTLTFRVRPLQEETQVSDAPIRKGFIRVYDRRGSYKTILTNTDITAEQLVKEAAAKFNVKGTYALYLKSDEESTHSTDDAPAQVKKLDPKSLPLQILGDMPRRQQESTIVLFKKTKSKVKEKSRSKTRDKKKKSEHVSKAIQMRIQAAKKKGALDLSFQHLKSFPEQFYELTSLVTLTLNSAGLEALPEMSTFTALSELRLVKNKFKTIPPEICGILTLTELDMGNNMITAFPPEIGNLTNLRELYMYVNYVTEIPEAFSQLTSLVVLNVAHNELKEFPATVLMRLHSLAQLKLSGNKLSGIPTEITQLSNLVDLNLSRNRIKRLPKDLGNLQELRWLNVCVNRIKSLPKDIQNIPYLEELLVTHNLLSTLPHRLPSARVVLATHNRIDNLPDDLDYPQIEEFCLAENKIMNLPSSVGRMVALQKLTIGENSLETLPENICNLRFLTQLDAKKNRLTSFPECSMQTGFSLLDLSQNRLTSLPSSLWHMPQLWYLQLAGNPISTFPTVTVDGIRCCVDMFLGDCKLENSDVKEIASFVSLRTLDIGYNRLTALDPCISALQQVTILNLSGNQLEELPEHLRELRSLRELHVANNRLRSLPQCLDKFNCLGTVDVSFNELTSIDAIILSLATLHWVDISHNPIELSDKQMSILCALEEFYCEGIITKELPSTLMELSHGVRSPGKRFVYSSSDLCGRRDGMEDCTAFVGSLNDTPWLDIACVLDGHGGRRVAAYAGKQIVRYVSRCYQELDAVADPLHMLRATFHEINEEVQRAAIGVMEGATAVAALIVKNDVYVANVGDTRAVLSRAGKAERLSFDHKPDLPEEEHRIRSLGGFVGDDQRVNAVLAVSRAFGDFALEPFVLCDPFMSHTVLQSDDQFLIIACDGVWDVMTDQDAVDLLQGVSPERAATVLRDHAYMLGSMDNISALVITIRPEDIWQEDADGESSSSATDGTAATVPSSDAASAALDDGSDEPGNSGNEGEQEDNSAGDDDVVVPSYAPPPPPSDDEDAEEDAEGDGAGQ